MQIRHYTTAAGRAPVKDFLQDLPEEARFEVLTLLCRLEQGEVRVFYYTRVKQRLFLVHALRKKSRTISDRDRDLIVKRIKEINQRYRGKEYGLEEG